MKYSPFLFLAAGAVGALARAGLYTFGVDSTGLLAADHPLYRFCWGLTFLAAAAAGVCALRADPRREIAPAPWLAGVCAVLSALGIGFGVIPALSQLSGALEITWAALGLLSIPAVLTAGVQVCRGRRPSFLLHGILCLFYAVHLICRYRVWSGIPQLADYDFQLLASVCLLLTAFLHTAVDAGMGQRRPMLFFSLMAGFFSLLCFARSDFPLLYLTGGLWALGSLAFPGETPQESPQEGEAA